VAKESGTDGPSGPIADAPNNLTPASKHTPGPWQVSGVRHKGDLKLGNDARLHMVGPDDDAVAGVFFHMQTGVGWADARLIAAAPELLDALYVQRSAIDILMARLIEVDPSFRPTKSEVWPMLLQGTAAITKATGAA
jgi:hypothetical protein